MSTKCTIGYGETFHLYEECFDSDNVWLRLDSPTFQIDAGRRESRVTVSIDVAVWRKIVEAWSESHWGKHPERDYVKEDLDLDNFENMLKSIAESREVKGE